MFSYRQYNGIIYDHFKGIWVFIIQLLIMKHKLHTLLSLIFFLLVLIGLTTNTVNASPLLQNKEVAIYFFWAYGCSYCEKAQVFLDDLVRDNPEVRIHKFEVYLNADNRIYYQDFLEAMGRTPQGLPTIVIGDQVWVGFQPDYKAEIINAVKHCSTNGCSIEHPNPDESALNSDNQNFSIDFPGLGRTNLSNLSLLSSTVLISLVDGVNPCSLWILTLLLSLAVYSKSRKKTFIIGALFILISALVYGLFITGIFSLLSVFGFLKWIKILVATIAMIFGGINIKDYFFFKKGVSLTISDDRKPGIYQKLRSVVLDSESFPKLLLGITLLAGGVSLVELSCTSGFPIIWSNLLTIQKVNTISYIALLAIYLFVYMIDEIIIFLAVVISMQAAKINEGQGRFLKLMSGILMILLGVVMLINPEWMNDFKFATLLFLAAILVSFIIHRIHLTLKTKSINP
jgi:cytochrome c biogenesis protein CcdA/glutaredoxin